MYHHGVKPRLIEAAEACFLRLGVARTTIDDVAREAKVSRATVYRHVRDRDELVLAVFARQADRFLERMTADEAQSVGDGIVYAVREVPNQPLLLEVMRNPPAGAWEVCVDRARDRMGGVLDGDEVEWVLRTVLSFLLLPSDRDEEDLRAFVARFLGVRS
jgi:AcrR family transcriptional regulator